MTAPIRIAVNGASGRMGGAIAALEAAPDQWLLQRAVVGPSSSCLNQPVPGAAANGLAYTSGWDATDKPQVIIDFSTPEALGEALAYCRQHGIALVSGTTGLDARLQSDLAAASADIPILRAANFSLGVAVLTRLLEQAAAALPEWDLEIQETHHRHKADAPSGTALSLGRAAAAARGDSLDARGVFTRHGHTGARGDGDIGFAVMRGGDIAGEHTAMLAGTGERVELSHRASDRRIFARGAVTAAQWLIHQPTGQYDFNDVVNARLS